MDRWWYVVKLNFAKCEESFVSIKTWIHFVMCHVWNYSLSAYVWRYHLTAVFCLTFCLCCLVLVHVMPLPNNTLCDLTEGDKIPLSEEKCKQFVFGKMKKYENNSLFFQQYVVYVTTHFIYNILWTCDIFYNCVCHMIVSERTSIMVITWL